jgi:hypothetical protein
LAHIIDRQLVEVNERRDLAAGPKEKLSLKGKGGKKGKKTGPGAIPGCSNPKKLRTAVSRNFSRCDKKIDFSRKLFNIYAR